MGEETAGVRGGRGTAGWLCRPEAFEAKEALREANMQLAQGHYRRGLAAFAHAFHASPRYVSRRVRDELRRTAVGNGVAPQEFWKRKEVLWA